MLKIKKILLPILLPLTFGMLSSISVFGNGIEEDSVFNHHFRQDIGGWIAADATYSIALPNNKTLWLFGDTFIGSVNEESHAILEGSKFIRNSAVLQEGDSFTTLYQGTASNPSAFLPTNHPDSTWYWPEHGFLRNDSLFIFVVKFHKSNGTDDGFNFEFAGNDIIIFKYPEFNYLKTIDIEASAINEVYYGDRILEDGEYLYIYGRKIENKEFNIAYPHLARTKTESISGNWEFFNGSGWSHEASSSKRINNFQVSQQYGVFKHEEKYVLITQDIWLSREIWSFTSTSPFGPWGNKTLIYTTPEKFPETFTYNAYPHPQFNDENELLLSYNSNGNFFSIFTNVEIYRPTFIRIPFKNIDPDFLGAIGHSPSEIVEQGLLLQNYPNPFHDYTKIEYYIGQKGMVSLDLFDLSGKHRGNILKEFSLSGHYSVDASFSHLTPGLYTLRLLAPGISMSKLMIKLP